MLFVNGAMLHGTFHDPLSFLLHSIAAKWGDLGQETSVAAMKALLNFTAGHREPIDSLITRFEIVRDAAEQDAQLVIGARQATWHLLKAIGVGEEQLERLLIPTNGEFPSTDVEYRNLLTALRKRGHIIEGRPGNIAGALRGGAGTGSRTYAFGD